MLSTIDKTFYKEKGLAATFSEKSTTFSNIDKYILLTHLLNIHLSSSSSQFCAELCQAAAAAITNTASSLPTVDLGQARPTTPRPLHRAPSSSHQPASNSVQLSSLRYPHNLNVMSEQKV